METPFPPLVTELSRPFWEGLRREAIIVQHCGPCSRPVFYPRPFCPVCGSAALEWRDLPPAATLYSFTVCTAPVAAEFRGQELVLAIVELARGVRMPSRLVDLDGAEPRIGMALDPVFDHGASAEWPLLYFTPARPRAGPG